MLTLQEFIHRLELGTGARVVRFSLGAMLVLILMAGYNFRAYKNMSTQEAMDAAQLGRNLAQGKGYTTLFVRPFSIYLLKTRHEPKAGSSAASTDPARLKGMHPDLANPPVYPIILAGLMKVLPFQYPVNLKSTFWSVPKTRLSSSPETTVSFRQFWRYEPDFVIALFNQILFFVVVGLNFLLVRRLFDSPVAWLSTLLLLGTEEMWRFSVSGLSTMTLLLIFIGLVWCLVLLEAEVREPKRGPRAVWLLAATCGFLVGVGALTRYPFAWLIVPVLVFVIVVTWQRGPIPGAATFAAFLLLFAPWVGRNYAVSGKPFGTATYAFLEGTVIFPEYRLQRSLEPNLNVAAITAIRTAFYKVIGNSRQIVQTDLPKLGGTWLAAFFLVGLLVPFKNPAVRRLRYFAIGAIAVLALAQALCRTQLSDDSPEINTENLLVLATPLVLTYGTVLLYLLLETINLPFLELRSALVALFAVVASLPLILTFLPPKTIPVSYPPYYPPTIQEAVGWIKEDELSMSDIPWAVAWYGQSQSVWLTLNVQPDFYTINDYLKPVQELYLTHLPTQGHFMSLGQWIGAGERGWRSFILDAMIRKGPPPGFPLKYLQSGWPEQLLITYRQHWPRG